VAFRTALGSGALKGARIGVLKNLLGAAPEDDEVSGIVRKALDVMKAEGAEIVEVTIPGLDEQLGASSLINLEFKTDLIDYLGHFPQAPVKSLQDILDRGAFHAALETTFKQRNAAIADPDAIRRVQARRTAVTALVTAAFAESGVEALAYPTMRRRPVVVEEPQRGSNCQLSATTGFPAVAMPAGFTPDGVPIGFEMLGPAWSDARLLNLAHAYEQAARPRRAPPTTPPLVNGRVPGILSMTGRQATATGRVDWRCEYDPVPGRLTFEFSPGVLTASLHRDEPGPGGAVLQRLIDPASPALRGSVVLPAYQRPWLLDGALRVTAETPGGRVTMKLVPPVPDTTAQR
jgi:hypothetical protein